MRQEILQKYRICKKHQIFSRLVMESRKNTDECSISSYIRIISLSTVYNLFLSENHIIFYIIALFGKINRICDQTQSQSMHMYAYVYRHTGRGYILDMKFNNKDVSIDIN